MGRLLLILFLLLSTGSFASSTKKAKHFLQLSELHLKTNIDSSEYYLELCKVNLDSIKNKELITEYYFTLAKYEFKRNKPNQAIYLFQKITKSFQSQNKLDKTALSYYSLAKINLVQNNYTNAINNSLEAKALFDVLNMHKYSYNCSNILGTAFFHVGQLYLAKEYFYEVEKYGHFINDEELLLSAYTNLANIYVLDSITKYNKAINYFRKAIKIASKNSHKDIASLYLNLSNVFLDKNLLDSAEYYLNNALKLAIMDKPFALSKIYFCFGALNEKRKDFKQSKIWFEKSIKSSHLQNDLASLRENYKRISIIQFENENYKEAFLNLEKSNAYNDSIIQNKHFNAIHDLSTQYKNENINHRIEAQNSKIVTQEITIRNQKYKNVGLVILLLMVTLIVFVIMFYSKRLSHANRSFRNSNETNSKKNKQLEQTIKTRDKLISTIAHDIKNPLGAISGFAELAIKSEDKNSIGLYNKQIYNSAIKLYNLLEDLVSWGKAQKELIATSPENINISEIVKQNFKIFQEMANKNNIKLINVCSTEHYINADKYTLSTALRNLINNAIKFSNKNGEIIIRSEQINDKSYIHITDTGIGISEIDIPKLFDKNTNKDAIGNHQKKGTGIGLALSNEFIKLNQGSISVRSIKDKGSCFTICLPDKAHILIA